jgi:hypothetical protein
MLFFIDNDDYICNLISVSALWNWIMTFICIELPTFLVKAMGWDLAYFAMHVCCVPAPSKNIWRVIFRLLNPVLKCHVLWWDVNILFRCCAALRTWHELRACIMQFSVLLYGRKQGFSLLRGTPDCMQPSVAFHFAQTYIHQAFHCSTHFHVDFIHVQATCLTTQILWIAHFSSVFKWIVCCSISILPKQEFENFTAILRGFSPPANYTDRATAACRRS